MPVTTQTTALTVKTVPVAPQSANGFNLGKLNGLSDRAKEALKTVAWTAPTGAGAGAFIADGFERLPGTKVLTNEQIQEFAKNISSDNVLNKYVGSAAYTGSYNLESAKSHLIDKMATLLTGVDDSTVAKEHIWNNYNHLPWWIKPVGLGKESLMKFFFHSEKIEKDQALKQASEFINSLSKEETVNLIKNPIDFIRHAQKAVHMDTLPFVHNTPLESFFTHSPISPEGWAGIVGAVFTGLIGAGMSQVFFNEKQKAKQKIADLEPKLAALARKKEASKKLADITGKLEVVENEQEALETEEKVKALETLLAKLQKPKEAAAV